VPAPAAPTERGRRRQDEVAVGPGRRPFVARVAVRGEPEIRGQRAALESLKPSRATRQSQHLAADGGGRPPACQRGANIEAQKAQEHDDGRPASIYDFEAVSITGEPAHLSSQRGKVLLIVKHRQCLRLHAAVRRAERSCGKTTATGTGDRGFPEQRIRRPGPGSNEEIASFCQLNYGVSFPMMAKTKVNGMDANRCGNGSRRRRQGCWAPRR